jgi:uncharacterized protein HemX
MPTLPRQSASTAFRSENYSVSATLPARRPTLPIPAAPEKIQPAPILRQRMQTILMLFLVFMALIVVSGGLVYLSGYAQMQREKYRQIKMQRALKQAKEIQQRWQHKKSVMVTASSIAAQAAKLGMVPADDKKMVTVGETRTITPEIPTPISTQ